MIRPTFVALALTVAAALAAPAARGQAAPPPTAAAGGATGGRIAVVNINAVQGKIQETAEFRAHIQNQQSMVDAGKKGHAAQLDDLRNQLRNLKPNSPQSNALQVQIDEKQATWNTEDQLKQVSLLREINVKKKSLYDAIMAATADLARQKKIDLVLVENDIQLPDSVQEMSPDQLNNLLAQRQMLYVSPKIDLTDEVCTALDAQYKAANNAGGGK